MIRMIIECVGASVLAISAVTVTDGALDDHIESYRSNVVEPVAVVDDAAAVLANVNFSLPQVGLPGGGGILPDAGMPFGEREADWEVLSYSLSLLGTEVLCYNTHDDKQFKSTWVTDEDKAEANRKPPEQRYLGYGPEDAACDRYDGQSMEEIGGYRDDSGRLRIG